ncbi:MAG: alanine/glycine:cation symporter family protein [Gemmatimonadales bacterium]
MEFFRRLGDFLNSVVWEPGIPVGDERLSFIAIALIGTGFFLTVRLGFIQLRRLGHGFAVASGKYDDPNEPGDVSHFQALTTALSATVGIGNIAGVAIAIHWGGPGALFWMWITALVGMATKFSEVTLAQKYRDVEESGKKWEGTVSGGPMYYIERGLGPAWKPMAIFFAVLLGTTAFFTGNAVQANTVADALNSNFGFPVWITGLVTAGLVGAVILGGISRIGRVTSVLAPLMAAVYVLGAMTIILLNFDQVVPAFQLIFREAFNPSAGIAGTGAGAFVTTLMWGVRRGLFSNEAGQGSAPIAHAAAKTDEPVSEGVVALLEPFIDTIIIVTMTALVIIMTGVWDDRVPEEITLTGGDLGWVTVDLDGRRAGVDPPEQVRINEGRPAVAGGEPTVAWHEVPVEELFTDEAMTNRFTGVIYAVAQNAVGDDGATYTSLYGMAVESGAPLTMLGFRRGLSALGDWGHYIVIFSVLLFAISTAISWSYYGDRCAKYLLGHRFVLPYKMMFVAMHFVGAVVPLSVIWDFGDIFLGIVILPNLIALIALSPQIVETTKSYFERKPWIENAEAHRRWKAEHKR